MKAPVNVVNPAQRSRAVSDLAAHFGFDAEQTKHLRLAMTPPALRHLPDHAGRGHKSLGRIQQINNRRRFKTRLATSR
jgi:hypothetical protein